MEANPINVFTAHFQLLVLLCHESSCLHSLPSSLLVHPAGLLSPQFGIVLFAYLSENVAQCGSPFQTFDNGNWDDYAENAKCSVLIGENADSVSCVSSGGSRECPASPALSRWKESGWRCLPTKRLFTEAVDHRNPLDPPLLLCHQIPFLLSPVSLSCSLRDLLKGLWGAKAQVGPAITETWTSVSHPHHPPTIMQRWRLSIRLPPPLPLHHHGPENTLVVHALPPCHFVETLRVATNTVCFLSPPQMSFLMVRRHSFCFITTNSLHCRLTLISNIL